MNDNNTKLQTEETTGAKSVFEMPDKFVQLKERKTVQKSSHSGRN